MRQIDIAATYGISESLVSRMIKGDRWTDNLSLAMSLSKLTGKKPKVFLRDNIRELAVLVHPELNRKVK